MSTCLHPKTARKRPGRNHIVLRHPPPESLCVCSRLQPRIFSPPPLEPKIGAEKWVEQHCFKKKHTLWWTNILPWKMAMEIVDFPINSMVIFHGKMLVHQRVYARKTSWNLPEPGRLWGTPLSNNKNMGKKSASRTLGWADWQQEKSWWKMVEFSETKKTIALLCWIILGGNDDFRKAQYIVDYSGSWQREIRIFIGSTI